MFKVGNAAHSCCTFCIKLLLLAQQAACTVLCCRTVTYKPYQQVCSQYIPSVAVNVCIVLT
jgi:hypothetical protein